MRLITLLFTLFFVASTYAAQVYKWVDEDGQTHFSQFPPETKQADKIQVNAPTSANPAAAAERLEKMRQTLREQAVDRVTQTEDEKKAEETAKRMAENCKKAKQQLLDLQNNGRVFRTLENGDREWYDEEGRQELINQAKQQVDKYCSK